MAPKLIHLKGCIHGNMLVGGSRMRDIVKQQKPMRVKCLDLKTGKVHWLQPSRYIISGLKNCFEVRTASGKRLIASDETKVYTKHGWKRLDNLVVGDKIVIEDVADTTNPARKKWLSKKAVSVGTKADGVSASTRGAPTSKKGSRHGTKASTQGRPPRCERHMISGKASHDPNQRASQKRCEKSIPRVASSI